MSNSIYTDLSIKTFKEILNIVDDEDQPQTTGIIIKFGADWCGPCKRIQPYCHEVFKSLNQKIICFDLNIEDEDNIELYMAYKQKKMITTIPVLFAYVSNPTRDNNHWWAPDFSVNSSQQHDVEQFFQKVKTLTRY